MCRVERTSRMDYASPLTNELVFALAAERLLDVEVPERCGVDPHPHV